LKKSKGCAIDLRITIGRRKNIALENGPLISQLVSGFAPKLTTLKQDRQESRQRALAISLLSSTLKMAWGKTLTLGL
jgi:hypothetical protein